MSLSERTRQWGSRLKLGGYLAAAVLFVLGMMAWRKYQSYRARAESRIAQTLQAANATGEAIENAEYARVHALERAVKHARHAEQARKKADDVAERLKKRGHENIADLIREWNRE